MGLIDEKKENVSVISFTDNFGCTIQATLVDNSNINA